jgi:deazaflavin-dependent oxidoreductase (nitroreductase family)
MAIEGTYVPSAIRWVRENVELYESSGGLQGNAHPEIGVPIVIVTMRGATTGDVRKIALMKVEHEGVYALVASMGGAPKNPVWYHNLVAHPDEVMIQDGPEPFHVGVHLAEGDERAIWWPRAVAAFPPYGEYQTKTDRVIPVFIATRV